MRIVNNELKSVMHAFLKSFLSNVQLYVRGTCTLVYACNTCIANALLNSCEHRYMSLKFIYTAVIRPHNTLCSSSILHCCYL